MDSISKKVSNGRNHVKQGTVEVSDFGDVYVLDLKSLWEQFYPDLSFASFKYYMLNSEAEFDFPYKHCLHQRYQISINTNDDLKVSELTSALSDEIDKVNGILDRFKDEKKMFTTAEFTSELMKIYKDKDRAAAISSAYIDLVLPKTGTKAQVARAIEFNKQFNKFRIKNRTYHNVKREFIFRSDLLKKLKSDDTSYSLYYPKTNKKDYDLFRALYLLELFGLCSYEIIGGENPEVFIRLNDPLKIARLSSEHNNYSNEILREVRKRHENSNAILKKFYSEIENDNERWDFIEDYFLGNDLIDGDDN